MSKQQDTNEAETPKRKKRARTAKAPDCRGKADQPAAVNGLSSGPAAVNGLSSGPAADNAASLGLPATTAAASLRKGMTFDRMIDTETEWVWEPFLPRGGLVEVVGETEAGKSTLLSRVIAQEAGGPTIEGQRSHAPGRALLYSPEENLSDRVKKRLQAAGADLSRIESGEVGEDGQPLPRMSLPRDLPKLERRLKEGRISLLAIDPLASYLDDDFPHKDPVAIRILLSELTRIARSCDCLIMFTLFYRKSREGSPKDWVAGSAAWVQFPRIVLGLGKDPDDPDQGVLCHVKNSIAKKKCSRRFHFEVVDGTPVFHPDGETGMSAEDLVLANQTPADKDALADAVAFLKDQLEDGDVPVKKLKKDSEEAGHLWGTIRKAKTKLGVKSHKEGVAKAGFWVWRKPESYPS